jgi:hypothetical protein
MDDTRWEILQTYMSNTREDLRDIYAKLNTLSNFHWMLIGGSIVFNFVVSVSVAVALKSYF